jgi:hypothetical protein
VQVAYLITAYHQPDHLARLVRALDCEWATFFIHVDGKVDIRPFRAALPRAENVFFLDGVHRTRCYWSGFNFLQAILNLLHVALDADVSFCRYALLTGSSYPIKPVARIQQDHSSDVELIRIDRRVSDLDGDNIHSRSLNYYWFTDYPLLNRLDMSGRFRRPLREALPFYHGSSWWSLTDNCIRYIVDYIAANPGFIRFFRTVRAPDEVFFHTIIRNSPFAGRVALDFERGAAPGCQWGRNDHGNHYVDWHAKVGRLPKVLDLADLDALLESHALFARKFEEDVSGPLLAELERQCLK